MQRDGARFRAGLGRDADRDVGGRAEVGDDEPGFGIVCTEESEVAVCVETFALAVAEIEGPSLRKGRALGKFQCFPVTLQYRFLLVIQSFTLIVDALPAKKSEAIRCSSWFSRKSSIRGWRSPRNCQFQVNARAVRPSQVTARTVSYRPDLS